MDEHDSDEDEHISVDGRSSQKMRRVSSLRSKIVQLQQDMAFERAKCLSLE